MIYLVGDCVENLTPDICKGEFDWFKSWLDRKEERREMEVEFDIETNVTPWWCDKVVRTVQFGDVDNQFVLQWSHLSQQQKDYIKVRVLESERWKKIIHNAMFECVVMLFHGVRIVNVFDTMLGEQVLYGGEQNVIGYGLDDVAFRRLNRTLDKSYQTAFHEDILTVGHIRYAAQDVTYLSLLKKEIHQDCQQWGLDWVLALENEVVLAFAEMTYHGMEVDQEWWISLQSKAEPIVLASQEKLNAWLDHEDFNKVALEKGYLSKEDRILINWNSGKQKSMIFSALFPELPGTTKAVLSKWSKTAQDAPVWMNDYLQGETESLTQYVLANHRQWLFENNFLIPAGVPMINWNSVDQVLPLIQAVAPVKNLNAESMGRVGHPIAADLEEFKDSLKLVSTYGESWLQNIEPDGMVRTSFNQVLTTGRVSSAKPNMQQIPAKESVGNTYRNAFVPPKGWKFVSSDYVSQELIIIAYLSNDPVWIEALSKGQDLHSVAAELVYKSKWRDAAEEGKCEYYFAHVDKSGKYWPENSKLKCSCKKHKYMRSGVKSINFGLAYGMSHFKLASSLRITVPEAKQLIIDYFKAFPRIGTLLTYLGRFGVTNGYIQTIWPFYRKRYFPYWKNYIRFIDAHLMDVSFHSGLGEIERASKNMPEQRYGHVKSEEFGEPYVIGYGNTEPSLTWV